MKSIPENAQLTVLALQCLSQLELGCASPPLYSAVELILRVLTYGPPIVASPARIKADPTKSPFIRAWPRDYVVDGTSAQAEDITNKFQELGFDSLASLCHADTTVEDSVAVGHLCRGRMFGIQAY